MANREEALKRLLKKVSWETPSSQFTKSVMNEIGMNPESSAAKEADLKSLLQGFVADAPASNFTHATMTKITQTSHIVPPLISRKAWYMIAAVLVFFVIAVSFSPASDASPQVLTTIMIRLGNYLNGLLLGVGVNNQLLFATFVCGGILLMLDRMLRKLSKK